MIFPLPLAGEGEGEGKSVRTTLTFNPLPPREGEEFIEGGFASDDRKKVFGPR
jgi:hypothetical protein